MAGGSHTCGTLVATASLLLPYRLRTVRIFLSGASSIRSYRYLKPVFIFCPKREKNAEKTCCPNVCAAHFTANTIKWKFEIKFIKIEINCKHLKYLNQWMIKWMIWNQLMIDVTYVNQSINTSSTRNWKLISSKMNMAGWCYVSWSRARARSLESKVVHTTCTEIDLSVCAKRVSCSGNVACQESGVEAPRSASLSKKSSKTRWEGNPTS